ncbi:hypothetical protein ACPF8X_13535 [Streptomyces sp. G35A]
MGKATAGIHKIVAGPDEPERVKSIEEWTSKLADDLDATLRRIKKVIES